MYLEPTIQGLRRGRQELEALPASRVTEELEAIDQALVALEGTVALEAAHEEVYGENFSKFVLDPRVPVEGFWTGIQLISLELDEVVEVLLDDSLWPHSGDTTLSA